MTDESGIQGAEESFASQLSAALRSAIDEFLGIDDWNSEALRGRLRMTIYSDKSEAFAIDGVEILRIGPFAIGQDNVLMRVVEYPFNIQKKKAL